MAYVLGLILLLWSSSSFSGYQRDPTFDCYETAPQACGNLCGVRGYTFVSSAGNVCTYTYQGSQYSETLNTCSCPAPKAYSSTTGRCEEEEPCAPGLVRINGECRCPGGGAYIWDDAHATNRCKANSECEGLPDIPGQFELSNYLSLKKVRCIDNCKFVWSYDHQTGGTVHGAYITTGLACVDGSPIPGVDGESGDGVDDEPNPNGDTDGDGIPDDVDPDPYEVNNPYGDTDNDGLPDFMDDNPYDYAPDSDGDGMPDQIDPDPGSGGPNGDTDNDGVPNDSDLTPNGEGDGTGSCGGPGQPPCSISGQCGGPNQPPCKLQGQCGGPNQPPCRVQLTDGREVSQWSGSGSLDCSTPPTCKGDPVQCAIAKSAWETACRARKGADGELSETDQNVVDGNAAIAEGKGDGKGEGNGNTDGGDISTMLNTDSWLGGGCITDQTYSLGQMGSITVPFSQLCTVFSVMGNILVALAMLAAIRIVGGGIM